VTKFERKTAILRKTNFGRKNAGEESIEKGTTDEVQTGNEPAKAAERDLRGRTGETRGRYPGKRSCRLATIGRGGREKNPQKSLNEGTGNEKNQQRCAQRY